MLPIASWTVFTLAQPEISTARSSDVGPDATGRRCALHEVRRTMDGAGQRPSRPGGPRHRQVGPPCIVAWSSAGPQCTAVGPSAACKFRAAAYERPEERERVLRGLLRGQQLPATPPADVLANRVDLPSGQESSIDGDRAPQPGSRLPTPSSVVRTVDQPRALNVHSDSCSAPCVSCSTVTGAARSEGAHAASRPASSRTAAGTPVRTRCG